MKLRLKKRRGPQAPSGRVVQIDRQRPVAFSYHAQRSDNPSATGGRALQTNRGLAAPPANTKSAQTRRRGHSLLQRSGQWLFLAVALVCAVIIVSLSGPPRIVLLGNQHDYIFRPTANYQKQAAQDLAASIWNRNKITFDNAAASQKMLKAFPELADVSISLPLIGQRPIYYLRANPPAFVLHSNSGSFVLDSSGKALITSAKANTDGLAALTGGLPVINDQTGLRVTPGRQVLSSQNAAFLQSVKSLLAAHGQTVASYDLPAGQVQEVDTHIAGQGYYIKFNMHLSDSVRQQVGTYLAAAANLKQQGAAPSQYMDVRVLGRAYYQ